MFEVYATIISSSLTHTKPLQFFTCRTSFYGEYQCSGPGANAKNRVTWSYQLTASQAAPFESISYIDGESWISS